MFGEVYLYNSVLRSYYLLIQNKPMKLKDAFEASTARISRMGKMMTFAIETRKLYKRYGEKPVEVDLDFRMNRKKILGLSDPCGAGKLVRIEQEESGR